MKIEFVPPRKTAAGTMVAFCLADGKFSGTAAALDKRTRGALKRAAKANGYSGRKDEILTLEAPAGLAARRIVLIGLGAADKIDDLAMEAAGARVVGHLNTVGETEGWVGVDSLPGVKDGPAHIAARMAFGAFLHAYRFDKYRVKAKEKDKKPRVQSLHFMVDTPAAARTAFAPLEKVGEGVFFTRDLVSEPANVKYPETLAADARSLAKLGVKIDVLDERRIRSLGMGALLGVAQGSARAPRVVTMRWDGDKRARDKNPIAFVGKGVTFDSGGISIKPAAGMEDMKWDMGGAGVVIGLMKALAGRKARVNAVGVIGLVENMPSGTAQRPGDIVTSMSGQTIEVLNTDAEGRLVLADALWYCQEKFKPRAIVDLATLTGAIVVALGEEYAGLFSNNDELASRLVAAGLATGEKLWRMPLADAYDRALDCDIADMKNIGNRSAGSITAAQFLQRFVRDVPWAHLDIAGVTWAKKDRPTVPKGGTAFGVRLLERLVAEYYED